MKAIEEILCKAMDPNKIAQAIKYLIELDKAGFTNEKNQSLLHIFSWENSPQGDHYWRNFYDTPSLPQNPPLAKLTIKAHKTYTITGINALTAQKVGKILLKEKTLQTIG